jgi:hypothetical protein
MSLLFSAPRWLALAACAAFLQPVLPVAIGRAQSTGIIVESVDDYSLRNGPSLLNSVANGNGFMNGMVFIPSSPWHQNAWWNNRAVYDTDFMASALTPRGQGNFNFDIPNTAISYFTGHGFCTDGCSTRQACGSSASCTTPNPAAGERMPGACRFSPMDAPRCCYMTDRAAATAGTLDQFNGVVDYTSGPIRWGESPSSGGWAGAGTNGGTNMVVLDISCGILPPFWNQAFQAAAAGAHLFATIMVAGGDTDNVADRGATFASQFAAAPLGRVSDAWRNTMNMLPATEGGGCPGGGGGHGFNGCGCNIVIAFDSTPQGANAKIAENWFDLQNDANDAKGNNWYSAVWQCNYPLRSTDGTARVLP